MSKTVQKSHAEYKADQRKKKRAEGYVERAFWINPDCADEIRDFIETRQKPEGAKPKENPDQQTMSFYEALD